MKVRLTQPGFKTYSGQMGVLFFENGLSTTDVSPHDAQRMAAVMLCEWEDGSSPSGAQRILDNMHTPAPVFTPGGSDHDTAREKAALMASARQDVQDTQNAVNSANTWTREQLEAIADKDGIKGLREVAEPLGIKGTSIKQLIAQILNGKTVVKE